MNNFLHFWLSGKYHCVRKIDNTVTVFRMEEKCIVVGNGICEYIYLDFHEIIVFFVIYAFGNAYSHTFISGSVIECYG